MDAGQVALLAGAGFIAGAVNTIAGAGSLLTFPALLATGLSPLSANVSNCIGLVPGSATGAYGMRSVLRGQRAELVRLSLWIAAGSVLGSVLLLQLPSAAFDKVIPFLVALAGLLVLAQPVIVRRSRREAGQDSRWTSGAVGTIGVYSGYFGAAQGVLLIGTIGALRPRPLLLTNATKNVLAVVGNGVAGVIYAVVAPVHWVAVTALAVGSTAGGPVGAVLAQRIPAGPLRIAIAVIALGVAVKLGVDAF